MKVITRFAPSPTGYFHAGSYRTALFSYIFARQQGGRFVLRIEDTDRERSKKEYEENIVDSLKWLGLDYDDFSRQSDHTANYRKHIERLIANSQAFVSAEKVAAAGERSEVIRFKNPNKVVVFNDLIRGRIEFDTTELGDFVIAKSLDEPVFHLAVVVDDAESGITHVIRGEDHISNTPRHILLYEALGFPVPSYAHIPLLLATDRSKLSKRNGAIPVTEYRRRGFLPAAVVNYLALLGWHPEDNREVMSFAEIIKDFSLERVQKAGAIFDEAKLRWFNRQYLLQLNEADFSEAVQPFLPEWLSVKSPVLKRLLPIIKDKIAAFDEVPALFEESGELHFVRSLPAYDLAKLPWKKSTEPTATAIKHLTEAKRLLHILADIEFDANTIKDTLWPYAEAQGRGDVLWPLRIALTGQDKSPDPFVSAAILGREESLKRLDSALHRLNTQESQSLKHG